MNIYIIEYAEKNTKRPIAILDDRILVDLFFSTAEWKLEPKTGIWSMNFLATHYKKEESGILEYVEVLEYSHLRPKPVLPKIRIPDLSRMSRFD